MVRPSQLANMIGNLQFSKHVPDSTRNPQPKHDRQFGGFKCVVEGLAWDKAKPVKPKHEPLLIPILDPQVTTKHTFLEF